MSKKEWPLWEVFIRSKQGLSHKHAGSLRAADAEMAIEILSDGLQKNILSLNSSGLVSEYELIYTVTYRVKNINSTEWSTPITLDLNRQYTFDNENIVAKELEEKRLIRGMKDELIRTMATQISLQKD